MRTLFTLAAAAAFSAGSAYAATTSYTDEASFLAAIGETPDTFIDFETGYADGDAFDGTTIGGATFDFSDNNARIEGTPGGIGGSNPIGGFAVEFNDRTDPVLTITFSSAITYFGAFYIDAGSPVINGVSFASTGASGDTALFGGLTFDLADNVTSIVYTDFTGDGVSGLDNISFGATVAAVPVPASLPLLLAAGGVLMGLRRRRKNA